jgi:hypothetical protein
MAARRRRHQLSQRSIITASETTAAAEIHARRAPSSGEKCRSTQHSANRRANNTTHNKRARRSIRVYEFRVTTTPLHAQHAKTSCTIDFDWMLLAMFDVSHAIPRILFCKNRVNMQGLFPKAFPKKLRLFYGTFRVF